MRRSLESGGERGAWKPVFLKGITTQAARHGAATETVIRLHARTPRFFLRWSQIATTPLTRFCWVVNIIFSFTRNKRFPHFYFYQKENLRNFFNLANYSIFRASLFGKVYVYTVESELGLFKNEIFTADVVFREIPENDTFFWAKSKFCALRSFINEFNEACLHIDFDLFLIKEFIAGKPDLIISHGEPYSDRGLRYLRGVNIPESCFLDFYNRMRLRLAQAEIGSEVLSWLNLGYAYNTSIFGGFNTSLLADICNKILFFVDRYNSRILDLIDRDRSDSLLYTAVWEQAALASICREQGITPASYGWPGNYLHFYSETKLDSDFIAKMERLIRHKQYLYSDPVDFFA